MKFLVLVTDVFWFRRSFVQPLLALEVALHRLFMHHHHPCIEVALDPWCISISLPFGRSTNPLFPNFLGSCGAYALLDTVLLMC
jgi:hypothetical protein